MLHNLNFQYLTLKSKTEPAQQRQKYNQWLSDSEFFLKQVNPMTDEGLV